MDNQTENQDKGWLANIGDFVGEKVRGIAGEKVGNRILAGAKLLALGWVAWHVLPTAITYYWLSGIALAAVGAWRGSQKKPVFKPFINALFAPFKWAKTLASGIAPILKNIDSTLDNEKISSDANYTSNVPANGTGVNTFNKAHTPVSGGQNKAGSQNGFKQQQQNKR